MTGRDQSPLSLPPPFTVVAFDSIGSTSEEAKARATGDAPHGTVVWALEQTQGRGRLDRQWSSPPGNLYCSTILRPRIPIHRAAELGFVAAIAVADFVAEASGRRARLKWPNDVLVEGAKISGILLESRATASGEVEWLVLGIGINLTTSPAGLAYPATSIGALGRAPPAPPQALASLIGHLASVVALWEGGGFSPIRDRWRALGHQPGDPIEIRQGSAVRAGCFHDIDGDGALLLATTTGVTRISVGDVQMRAA